VTWQLFAGFVVGWLLGVVIVLAVAWLGAR
jgi:hypothetical protein